MSSPITEPLATTIEEPLARLVAFEPTTFPVLSVYLNTQPDQHGRTSDAVPYLHGEFKALARTWAPSSPERHSFDQDVAHLEEQYPRYAAMLTDTNSARIFVFGLGQVLGAEEVKGKKVHRVKVGGWSQARYQRRVGNAHQEHAKEVIERLAEIVRADKVSHIILAGDAVVIPLLQEQLPQEMVSMVEVMRLDIHASDQD